MREHAEACWTTGAVYDQSIVAFVTEAMAYDVISLDSEDAQKGLWGVCFAVKRKMESDDEY